MFMDDEDTTATDGGMATPTMPEETGAEKEEEAAV